MFQVKKQDQLFPNLKNLSPLVNSAYRLVKSTKSLSEGPYQYFQSQKPNYTPTSGKPILKDLLNKQQLREKIYRSKGTNDQFPPDQRKSLASIGIRDLVTKVEFDQTDREKEDKSKRPPTQSQIQTPISSGIRRKQTTIIIPEKLELPKHTKSFTPTTLQLSNSNVVSTPKKETISKSHRSSSQTKKVLTSYTKNSIYYYSSIEHAYKKKYSLEKSVRIVRDHFLQTYQGLNLLLSSYGEQPKCVKLPKKHPEQITLIFDLDETLVHCNENASLQADVYLDIPISPQETIKAGINIRPHIMAVLQSLSKDYEIIVFTASHSCYANQVLNYIDPQNTLFSHRLYREHCTHTQMNLYTKDLRVLCDQQNRPFSRILLVDNASYSYAWQLENGIPIIPFYDQRDDTQLLELEKYIRSIDHPDVREYNKQHLKLQSFCDPRGPQKAYETIFGYQMP